MLSLLFAIKALRFLCVSEAHEMGQPLTNRQDPVYRLQRHDAVALPRHTDRGITAFSGGAA